MSFLSTRVSRSLIVRLTKDSFRRKRLLESELFRDKIILRAYPGPMLLSVTPSIRI